MSIEVTDSTLYVGDGWYPEDNFLSATDEFGEKLPLSKVEVKGEVDTDKPGDYPVTYKNGTVEKTITVKVLEVDDPLDPTDPNQRNLILEKVPENYHFKAALQEQEQMIETSTAIDSTVDVFNDQYDSGWFVKAEVVDNELNLTDRDSKLAVNSFQINNTELVGTGITGIIAKSADDKTIENNTGLIQTPVTDLSITFTDSNRELRDGDSLEGSINYQLYTIPSAK